MKVRVKICGITCPEDGLAAVRAGADYLGLVFAEGSVRRVDPADAADWIEDVREGAEVVGVFRDSPLDEVLAAVDRCDLDFVQLHGVESGQEWQKLPVRLIETRIVTGVLPPSRFGGTAWAQLLDSGAGAGQRFDWSVASEIARSERLFLAGGLDPQNVADAVRLLRPFAVDVSTGVEASPGRKDPQRIAAFVRAAREAISV